MRRRKWLVGILIGLIAVLTIGTGGFILWAKAPLPASPEVINTMNSDSQVRVDTEPWYQFTPVDQPVTTGLILYPGGRVDAAAYAPAAREIARQGYLVVLPEMVLNLAVLSPGIAGDIIVNFPQVENWAIGGHSLGGAMAARYTYQNPDQIDGLVLWASYPAESNDLSNFESLKVVSIFASEDSLAQPEDIAASMKYLPFDTSWVKIDGGNHAGFGYYGPQDGDNPATISLAEQQTKIVDATVRLLASLGDETQ